MLLLRKREIARSPAVFIQALRSFANQRLQITWPENITTATGIETVNFHHDLGEDEILVPNIPNPAMVGEIST